jgi:hypothetical protein
MLGLYKIGEPPNQNENHKISGGAKLRNDSQVLHLLAWRGASWRPVLPSPVPHPAPRALDPVADAGRTHIALQSVLGQVSAPPLKNAK